MDFEVETNFVRVSQVIVVNCDRVELVWVVDDVQVMGVAVVRLAWDESVAIFLTCSLIDSTLLLKKWMKSRGVMEGGGAGGEVLVRFAIVLDVFFGHVVCMGGIPKEAN